MKCRRCNCTESHACFEPALGVCFWIHGRGEQPLCSHCATVEELSALIEARPLDTPGNYALRVVRRVRQTKGGKHV